MFNQASEEASGGSALCFWLIAIWLSALLVLLPAA